MWDALLVGKMIEFDTWHCGFRRTERCVLPISLILTDHDFRILTRGLVKARLTTWQRGWLQGVENWMGSLPQGQRRSWQTSLITYIVFLLRDCHCRRGSWPHQWAPMRRQANCGGHSTAHGWAYKWVIGEMHISLESTRAWGALQWFPHELAWVSQDLQLLLHWIQSEKHTWSDHWAPCRCWHHRTAPQVERPHSQ